MKRLLCSVFGLAMLAPVGCDKGSATAPSQIPNKPSAVRKLEVKSPGEQKITQDKADEMTISISRDNFAGPVEIELRDLPKGVTVETKDMTIPADKTSLAVTVKAAPEAATMENHVVTVAAKAKDQKDMPEATTTFKMDVKPKK